MPPIRLFEGSGEPRAQSMDQYSAGQFQLNVSGSRTGGTFDSDYVLTRDRPHPLAVSSDRRVVPRLARPCPCVARRSQVRAQLGVGLLGRIRTSIAHRAIREPRVGQMSRGGGHIRLSGACQSAWRARCVARGSETGGQRAESDRWARSPQMAGARRARRGRPGTAATRWNELCMERSRNGARGL